MSLFGFPGSWIVSQSISSMEGKKNRGRAHEGSKPNLFEPHMVVIVVGLEAEAEQCFGQGE
jgi:hypothetical protein